LQFVYLGFLGTGLSRVCRSPPGFQGPDTPIGGKTNFKCGAGKAISGPRTAKCNPDGTWSPGYPTCVSE